ncbi:ABC transporter ATP-binding protein [Falsiruegeria mediterranea]|uniref:Lipopolysaccharide export system ATP-binding protein LptB n=1 Tax=Falsiruegeria mediterranea M17 TaxID=1200281 RepID=A0A2R8C973_9RHOB|nr:ATP-binding cassette domain-containing protein [Falsiruegeria mediterranea]SPJ28979.1 Lipopolysaccharide export system ATP-binding protein LptB [Falsiruegeria mediterranea M17]
MFFGCEGVCLSFGGRRILDKVNCSAEPGRINGLVGPNGAGKTSLFEVMSGRYTPEQGSVVLDGEDLTRLPFHNRARAGLARTFQSPVVPSTLTVGEAFRAARKSHRPYLSKHDAEWAARLVHLEVSWETPAASLGTFDRRKLLLACLVMRRPRVLLMDEPASGLINAEIDELDLIMRRLVDEYAMAVILIEHRLELLAAVADDCVVLDLGRVIATGDPLTVFDDPAVREAYFETPDA